MSSAANTLPAWRRSSLPIALVGSLLLWASLPPLALGWLGWIAPVPWLLLARMDVLPGRRPYRAIYVAGLAFWLASLYWLCLPHPILSLGWIALSAYLAIYLPIFVGLTRVAVHRCYIPLWLAAPVVWTGLELARAHMLTGFLMASLAHTQVKWTMLIQISDVVGEYGVDFVVMLVAASIASQIPLSLFAAPNESKQREGSILFQLVPLVSAVIVLATTLAYGHWRLVKAQELTANSLSKGPRLALIQGDSSADMKFDSSRERQIMTDYMDLSSKAIAKAGQIGDGRPVDLVVWPETMFRTPLITFDKGYRAPPGSNRTPEEIAAYGPHDLEGLVKRLGTPVMVGVDRVHYPITGSANSEAPPLVFNATVLVGHQGEIIGTYDKMHRVMFGEYIPFADWFPFLYGITPLTGGIVAGEAPAALRLDGVYCFSPNICYETAIPHVIRRQVATLENRDEYPNALVNMTNDAWYWGSSELDMHLACGVFRAVETRLPLVIAANGGISAWIDHLGHVRAKSPRQQATFIIADIEPSGIESYYVRYGDWFSAACLACCIVLAALGWKSRRNLRKVIETRN
jgi:apolipoprotein N-acyltransferase